MRPEAIPSKVQIVKRDASAYVEEIQIDGVSLTGEEAADARTSFCLFFTEPQENGISITVKGNGHGYSQASVKPRQKQQKDGILNRYWNIFTVILNFALNKDDQTGKNTSEVIKGER